MMMFIIIVNNYYNNIMDGVMKLSTKGGYGPRALLDIALHQGEGPVPLKDIAQRRQVSLSYLERIIAPLSAAGLIQSMRGPHGGVMPVKSPEQMRLSDIIQVLEGFGGSC
jgi:Rrf2 family cysteine metabolism transcriptional repressor